MSLPRYPEYKDSGVEWLGQVPAHWGVPRLRFTAHLNPSKSEVRQLPAETAVTFLPMEAIGDDGSVDLSRERTLADVAEGYTFVRDGDVAFAKITPCFENGKGAIMRGLQNGIGFGTTELIVIRPHEQKLSPSFLHYLFTSALFRQAGESTMYGAGGQKRVPDSFVRDAVIPLPSMDEQEMIGSFLDRETAKIDALVAEQERLIALLKEKRQAAITQVITKGLNPNAAMKESGSELIGKVPAHWNVLRAKHLSSFTTSGPRGWSEKVGDEGRLFIQSGDLNDNLGIAFEEAKRVVVTLDAETVRTELRNGDVLVCITGARTGNVAVCERLTETAFVNQHLCLLRPNNLCLPKFLALALKSDVGQRHFMVSQYGLKQGLSLEDVRDALIPVPPIAEQNRICEYIERFTLANTELAEGAHHMAAVLAERRAALVSSAVTGQIDVRGHASVEAA